MKQYWAIAIAILLMVSNAEAQRNLVKNPGFEEMKGKIRDQGQIAIALDWLPATEFKPDLYSEKAKLPTFGAPDNINGSQPAKGDTYAGFVGFSYKESASRTYLRGELHQPLEAGRDYCLKYWLSLSDLSKFAVNNIGMYLDSAATTQEQILTYTVQPQLKDVGNSIQEEMYIFEPVCTQFTAKGGEKYLTIGNFAPQDEVNFKKMKRPKGMTKPQTNLAYYYVDNVAVIPVDSLKDKFECSCGAVVSSSGETMHRVVRTAGSMSVTNFPVVKFDAESAELTAAATATLDEVYKLMKHVDHATTNVRVTGQITAAEKEAGLTSLAAKRSVAVRDYLIKKGIQPTRLAIKSVTTPSATSKPEVAFKLAN